MMRIKRIYQDASDGDGERILIDRPLAARPCQAKAAIDLWAKEAAPSCALRTWFDHRPEGFNGFRTCTLRELRSNPAGAELRQQIGRKTATLLYAARDPVHNHAVVLAEFLQKARS
ncbi:DUF488 domain-containing protein [Bradyrhizobium sp. STM 3557]|uniref:DUF488 domain-containing protein n=1 Tax=Bradyrhizobium sp. STM 3557 TaxID=578920 RepID=UPI00388EF08A